MNPFVATQFQQHLLRSKVQQVFPNRKIRGFLWDKPDIA